MKFGIFTLIFLLLATCSYAQQVDTIRLKNKGPEGRTKIVTDRAPQAVYFGIGGSGPILSVNYDRRFGKRLNGFGFTAGLGFFGDGYSSVFSIPASINYLIGRQSHFLELATGVTFATEAWNDFENSSESSETILIGHFNFGYRYQPSKGGLFVRTGVSPLFAQEDFVTSFYLGLGYCF